LPSGETLSGMSEVTDTRALLTLEAEERSPRETLSWAYVRQSVRQASGITGELRSGDIGVPSVEIASPLITTFIPELSGFYRPSTVRDGWPLSLERADTTVNVVDSDTGVDKVDNRLLRSISLLRLIGGGAEAWHPLYLRCRSPMLSLDRLLAIPPSYQTTILLVRAGADGAESDSWIRPLVASGHPGAEALLSYMEQGSTSSARRIAPKIIDEACSSVASKGEDPISAVIAGYFMLQMGRMDRPGLLDNLVNSFPALPDASIIYGVNLLRGKLTPAGREAPEKYFLKAVSNGIPVYTIGLRLLFASLERLMREDRPEEERKELSHALAKVRVVAAYADWESPTTSFAVPPSGPELLFQIQ
jgi:hypothetical protein